MSSQCRSSNWDRFLLELKLLWACLFSSIPIQFHTCASSKPKDDLAKLLEIKKKQKETVHSRELKALCPFKMLTSHHAIREIGHLVGGPFFLNHSIASQSGQWVIRTIRLRFLCIEHAETHWLDRLNQSTADFSGQLWTASCACTLPRRYGQELLGCSRGISLHRESIYFEDQGAPSEPPDQPAIYNLRSFNPFQVLTSTNQNSHHSTAG